MEKKKRRYFPDEFKRQAAHVNAVSNFPKSAEVKFPTSAVPAISRLQ